MRCLCGVARGRYSSTATGRGVTLASWRCWATGGGAVVALASALTLGLWRGHAAVLLRSGLLVSLAVAAAWLAGRNNEVVDVDVLSGLALGFFTPAAVLLGSAVSGPLLGALARGQWLLCTSGASGRTRLAALVVAVSGVGAGLGALAAGVLTWVWSLAPLASAGLLCGLMLCGGGLAGLAGLVAYWAQTQGTRGPGRLLAVLFGVVVVAVAVVVRGGIWGPWVLLAVMLLTWLIGHVRAETQTRGGAGPRGRRIVACPLGPRGRPQGGGPGRAGAGRRGSRCARRVGRRLAGARLHREVAGDELHVARALSLIHI